MRHHLYDEGSSEPDFFPFVFEPVQAFLGNEIWRLIHDSFCGEQSLNPLHY